MIFYVVAVAVFTVVSVFAASVVIDLFIIIIVELVGRAVDVTSSPVPYPPPPGPRGSRDGSISIPPPTYISMLRKLRRVPEGIVPKSVPVDLGGGGSCAIVLIGPFFEAF